MKPSLSPLSVQLIDPLSSILGAVTDLPPFGFAVTDTDLTNSSSHSNDNCSLTSPTGSNSSSLVRTVVLASPRASSHPSAKSCLSLSSTPSKTVRPARRNTTPSLPPPARATVAAASLLMDANHAVLISDELQLAHALGAFAWAHHKHAGWAAANFLRLKAAGIVSMSDLSVGCKEETVNLDLELFGFPAEERLARETVQALRSFLPGPVGFRCFRLAQMAAHKVDRGQANTEYVHRPESGARGDEVFRIKPLGDAWVLKVDCAGFVRNCLKHVTKDPFVMALSDRDFMRAKDFFGFFSALPHTVMDPPTDERIWRRIDDLRMIIPGDVIVYRPRGSAAGGAAFTTNDRKDLSHLLRAVQTAILWHAEHPKPCRRNVAKDPAVRAWVKQVRRNLNTLGIHTVKELHGALDRINDLLQRHQMEPLFTPHLLQLMRECAETTAQNTGHIVFASGPAIPKGNGMYRIRVVHSTKYGKRDENGNITRGVQEYFRRFQMITDERGETRWTREMKENKPLLVKKQQQQQQQQQQGNTRQPYQSDDDEDDNPADDMEEDPQEDEDDDNANSNTTTTTTTNNNNNNNNNSNNNANGDTVDEQETNDELSGQAMIEVIAARMCF